MIATEGARIRNPASCLGGALGAGLLAALIVLQGCAGDDPGGGRESGPPPPVAAAARQVDPVTVADPGASVEATRDDASVEVDPIEAEKATRRAAAQSYLENAQVAASKRHRLALADCQSSVEIDFETCVATADQSLEAELRSARVEFDAQMEVD